MSQHPLVSMQLAPWFPSHTLSRCTLTTIRHTPKQYFVLYSCPCVVSCSFRSQTFNVLVPQSPCHLPLIITPPISNPSQVALPCQHFQPRLIPNLLFYLPLIQIAINPIPYSPIVSLPCDSSRVIVNINLQVILPLSLPTSLVANLQFISLLPSQITGHTIHCHQSCQLAIHLVVTISPHLKDSHLLPTKRSNCNSPVRQSITPHVKSQHQAALLFYL